MVRTELACAAERGLLTPCCWEGMGWWLTPLGAAPATASLPSQVGCGMMTHFHPLPAKSAGLNTPLLHAKPALRWSLVDAKRARAHCKELRREKFQTWWAPHGLKKRLKYLIVTDAVNSMVWLNFKMKITFVGHYIQEKFPPWQWQLIFSPLLGNRRNILTPSPWKFKTYQQNEIGKPLSRNEVAWKASDFWR